MGSSGYGHEASGSGSGGSKVRNQAAAQTQSVKMSASSFFLSVDLNLS